MQFPRLGLIPRHRIQLTLTKIAKFRMCGARAEQRNQMHREPETDDAVRRQEAWRGLPVGEEVRARASRVARRRQRESASGARGRDNWMRCGGAVFSSAAGAGDSDGDQPRSLGPAGPGGGRRSPCVAWPMASGHHAWSRDQRVQVQRLDRRRARWIGSEWRVERARRGC